MRRKNALRNNSGFMKRGPQVVDPGSADTFTYAWVFGDGTANGTTATVSHTYVDNGSFIAA
ncbi:MAG: PKD domain-containing protein, partial [Myxococcota bacterium]|nr:PKD domain-containing protein [Myxococcota bacterium]